MSSIQSSSSVQKIGIGLVRRSSHQQKGNNSFAIQEQTIRENAKRLGYTIPNKYLFYEDGVSAYSKTVGNRKVMQQIKEIALSKDIDALFFYDYTRVDRTITSFVTEFYNEVIQQKPHIKLFIPDGEWSPRDMMTKLHFLMANLESSTKSRRTTDNQITDLKRNNRPGSTTPYGYQFKDKKLYINDKESLVVLFIFHLSSWGHSVETIAKTLNDAKIPSPNNSVWHGSTIFNILNSKTYQGTLHWNFRKQKVKDNEFVIQNSHEKIVPQMLYQIIDTNNELKRKYNKFDTPFLFSNLLVCKECGEKLSHRNNSTTRNGKKYVYLKYECKQCSYRIDTFLLNEKIINYIQRHFSKSILINSSVVYDKLKENFDTLNKKHEHLLDQMNLVLVKEKLALTTQSNHKEINSLFKTVKEEFEFEINHVLQAIEKNKILLGTNELQVFVNNFKDISITKLTSTEQRLMILYFVDKIYISCNDSRLEFILHFKINPISALT